LGSEANDLIWGKYISSTEVIRRAQELVDKCNRHLPKSADTSKKWVQETFGSMDDLFKNVMALHVAIFTCSWRATSGVENVFNVFKKYKKGNLKRSLLHDAVMELLEMVQRRLQNDCVLIHNHPEWFIDSRVLTNPEKDRKKKLSTRQLFLKEMMKLQDGSKCPWNDCIPFEEKKMWLLFEKSHDERQIAHLVDLNGFAWADTEDNIPPKCHSCPCYRNGRIPCIGILTVLQHLKPLVGPATISEWMGGKGLEKPELFDRRWRVDKDPTIHLSEYLLAPRTKSHERQPATHAPPVISADLSRKFQEQLERVENLNPVSKAAALARMSKSLSENEAILARFELDVKIQKMSKSLGSQRSSTIRRTVSTSLGSDTS
jgi:hypothetical protein